MANRFPLIVNSVSETVRELASGDNLDLTSSGIYNNGATLTLPTATGTLATLAGTETFTNKTLTTPIIGTSVDSNDATFTGFATPTTLTIGYASTASSTTNISTGAVASGNTKTVNIGTGGAAGSTTNINLGDNDGGTVTVNKDLIVTGDLTVNGSITTINSTTLSVDDKNIELGSVASPTNTTADGGGITLKGSTDKTFNWVNATSAWTSSEDLNLLTGKVYEINGTSVLSSTTLGSNVVTSSLTTVGTIGTGTWQGTIISPTYGGTGVNNGSRTITLNTGNLTVTAPAGGSSVTVPATGTLVGSSDTGTVTSTMIADGTIVNADINASAAIAITKLANSTISGISLGQDLATLTIGSGLSGGSYNGGTAVTIANSDKGSTQNIFKNIAVAGQTTVTASSNTDTFTLVAGPNVAIATDGAAKTITFSAGGGGWLVKTANHTASLGESILANTSGGAFTITLPSSASAGSQITIADGNNWSANPLTVARNGNTIMGSATNLILSYTGTKVDFIYSGSTWNVYGNTPGGDDVLALGLALGDEF
jgi:hypothetical protein